MYVARQEGLEPPAYCLEGSCSIQLSYWRMVGPPNDSQTTSADAAFLFWKRKVSGAGDGNRTHVFSLEG